MNNLTKVQELITNLPNMVVNPTTNPSQLKTFSCTYNNCGKIFRYYSELARHMKSHTNERTFKCPHCSQAFKRSDTLLNHSRLHNNQHPYSCPEPNCTETFPSKARLRYHMLKHSGEKKYACDIPGCNRTFLTSSQLNQHKKSIKYHKMIKTIPQDQNLLEPVKINDNIIWPTNEQSPTKVEFVTFNENEEIVKKVLLENLILSKKVQHNTQSIMFIANSLYLATQHQLLTKLLQQ